MPSIVVNEDEVTAVRARDEVTAVRGWKNIDKLKSEEDSHIRIHAYQSGNRTVSLQVVDGVVANSGQREQMTVDLGDADLANWILEDHTEYLLDSQLARKLGILLICAAIDAES